MLVWQTFYPPSHLLALTEYLIIYPFIFLLTLGWWLFIYLFILFFLLLLGMKLSWEKYSLLSCLPVLNGYGLSFPHNCRGGNEFHYLGVYHACPRQVQGSVSISESGELAGLSTPCQHLSHFWFSPWCAGCSCGVTHPLVTVDEHLPTSSRAVDTVCPVVLIHRVSFASAWSGGSLAILSSLKSVLFSY